ncbi:glycoside hydrolase family 3 protein [Bifidobacterium oedipodis]|uniref:beta-N-acetylhexosaminidase n=1 Tax=Bifidobacterium oedipodis TaxID=2675322 RepID=A0A7Y0HQL7_9BIFI|nr:glycoside hydrolase family 3 protein [Bifidobacterium sp. DSM 109957]NMM93030.1 beta-hexosaminidase [Bifidobacterium sp. DSM 109957]
MAPSVSTTRKSKRLGLVIVSVACVLAIVLTCVFAYGWTSAGFRSWLRHDATAPGNSLSSAPDTQTGNAPDALIRSAAPAPDMSDEAKARRAVAAMSLEERIGQLVMVPLFAGTDPASLQSVIADRYAGSVLIIGNWTGGTAQVRTAVDQLQSYAPAGNRLLVTTDQEGGLVQHLTGPGFDTMPSATAQGAMSADQLCDSAKTWGEQLAQAGINVDLAPVAGTVTTDRWSNAPIGALNRDFGLDASGNAEHAIAFVEGMRQAGVQSAIKHYPGLGAVTGNTDFTADGILDTTTVLSGPEAGAFDRVISDSDPAMVMMALATYQAIDPNNPAVFSSTIIDGHIRGDLNYEGVITSDSLSAAAVSGYDTTQLGVKLIEAGGDLACIGQSDYIAPILDGLNARAAADPAFADKATRAAERVITLKFRMGLAQ